VKVKRKVKEEERDAKDGVGMKKGVRGREGMGGIFFEKYALSNPLSQPCLVRPVDWGGALLNSGSLSTREQPGQFVSGHHFDVEISRPHDFSLDLVGRYDPEAAQGRRL